MFSSKSTENLAFVSRQLANLLKEASIDDALDKLSSSSPDEYASDVAYIKSLLDGSGESRPELGPNPYDAIARLLPSAKSARDTLFKEFVTYVQQSKIVFETYWAGVVGLIWYLAGVSVVALIVGYIYSTAVVPSFSSMFGSFGETLPDYTQAVFDFGGVGIPTFAVVLALTVGLVVFFVSLFHRRIQQMAPLPRWPKWAPILGRIAETYNLGLFLNYANILRKCGVDARVAVADAAAASNQAEDLALDTLANDVAAHRQSNALTELGIAARLGNLDSELSHQCEQHVGNLTLALVEARDRFSLVLKIALYLFAAALIIAMYLPIFKLGSVV
ncbi:MAG: hypothetical protein QNJ11_08250 [Woeseiaceae bacterium]|nr:hypothetical protein [Woeseiaceae bacterium]